jgi:hypothetical protein
MSEWTKQRLDQMISDGVEENLLLDYKRADSLAKTDGKKTEVTKDVSSFANSSGGVLIYGVAEFDDDARRHLPERLDPIQRSEIKKEWLDQVIQTIQPRIEGVVIHPVTISEPDNTVCYVVEVPQSHTAHMARDHRYHKRHNFTTAHMEDYEVRDVMNRKTHPKIRAFIRINRPVSYKHEGTIVVRLENYGHILARHVMVELEVPINVNGLIQIDKPSFTKKCEDGSCWTCRLHNADVPLFAGGDVVLRKGFNTDVSSMTDSNRKPLQSTRNLVVRIFADDMPPIKKTMDCAGALLDWIPINPEAQSTISEN